jgi:hypothetical protein
MSLCRQIQTGKSPSALHQILWGKPFRTYLVADRASRSSQGTLTQSNHSITPTGIIDVCKDKRRCKSQPESRHLWKFRSHSEIFRHANTQPYSRHLSTTPYLPGEPSSHVTLFLHFAHMTFVAMPTRCFTAIRIHSFTCLVFPIQHQSISNNTAKEMSLSDIRFKHTNFNISLILQLINLSFVAIGTICFTVVHLQNVRHRNVREIIRAHSNNKTTKSLHRNVCTPYVCYSSDIYGNPSTVANNCLRITSSFARRL